MISFFATLFTYNLAHSKGITEEKWRIPVLVISFSAVMYFSFNSLPLTSILILSFLGIISILYSIQIRKLQLRRMPGFKIFWIALVWSVAVFLPWIEVLQPTIWMVIPQWLSVLCFVLAISIPFDIRDVYYDEPALSTFPQKFGIQASVRLSTQLLMLSAALFLIGFQFELNQITHAFLINILISILLIRKMLRPRNFWFTDLWIEGLSGLFLVIYFILGL
ncbi:MAG: hypothetical protein Q4G27_11165 [Flavobacteriaceae bacterium]|nr:hypothetical protein [Flavobacteriaceae bacterium]